MKRRGFLKNVGALFMLAAVGISSMGVSCQNVFTDLLNWIPVGLSAVASVLTLLSGAGIVLGPMVVATIGLITASLNDLKLAIVEYQSTTPPPAGALAKIDTFLADLVSNLGNALQQLPTGTTNVITLVVGLVELVLSTIQGFVAQVPPAWASLQKTRVAFTKAIIVNGQVLAVGPRPRHKLTRRSFIHDWNHMATSGGHPEAKLPESLIQHL